MGLRSHWVATGNTVDRLVAQCFLSCEWALPDGISLIHRRLSLFIPLQDAWYTSFCKCSCSCSSRDDGPCWWLGATNGPKILIHGTNRAGEFSRKMPPRATEGVTSAFSSPRSRMSVALGHESNVAYQGDGMVSPICGYNPIHHIPFHLGVSPDSDPPLARTLQHALEDG